MKFALKGLRGIERGLARGVNATWAVLPKGTRRAIKGEWMHPDSQYIALAREHIDAIRAYYEWCGGIYTPPEWAYVGITTKSTGGPMKVSSSSSDPNKKEYEITFKGTKEEVEKIEGALLHGTHWVRGADGKHEFAGAYLPAPPPVSDLLISEQWPPEGAKPVRSGDKTPELKSNAEYRSIYLWHLSGKKADYRKRARTLELWGFECLRSRRGKDGKIWECWYLGGMMLAKGDLKGTAVKDVVTKIYKHINPGVLEFAGERWCLTID